MGTMFTQHVIVNCSDPEALVELLRDWTRNDASDAPGYQGGRVLAFRDKPGRYVVQADFTTWEDAQKNNDRPQTQEWAQKLMALIDGEPKYENLDVVAVFD